MKYLFLLFSFIFIIVSYQLTAQKIDTIQIVNGGITTLTFEHKLLKIDCEAANDYDFKITRKKVVQIKANAKNRAPRNTMVYIEVANSFHKLYVQFIDDKPDKNTFYNFGQITHHDNLKSLVSKAVSAKKSKPEKTTAQNKTIKNELRNDKLANIKPISKAKVDSNKLKQSFISINLNQSKTWLKNVGKKQKSIDTSTKANVHKQKSATAKRLKALVSVEKKEMLSTFFKHPILFLKKSHFAKHKTEDTNEVKVRNFTKTLKPQKNSQPISTEQKTLLDAKLLKQQAWNNELKKSNKANQNRKIELEVKDINPMPQMQTFHFDSNTVKDAPLENIKSETSTIPPNQIFENDYLLAKNELAKQVDEYIADTALQANEPLAKLDDKLSFKLNQIKVKENYIYIDISIDNDETKSFVSGNMMFEIKEHEGRNESHLLKPSYISSFPILNQNSHARIIYVTKFNPHISSSSNAVFTIQDLKSKKQYNFLFSGKLITDELNKAMEN